MSQDPDNIECRSQVALGQQVQGSSPSTYAAVAATSPATTVPKPSPARKTQIFRKKIRKDHARVNVSKTSTLDTPLSQSSFAGVRLSTELIGMIILCARFDRRTLSRLSRVCREWFSEVTPILWQHADPSHLTTFVQSLERRKQYAMHFRSIRFWSHEKFWSGTVAACPSFSSLRSLELYDKALRNNGAEELLPFLTRTLDRLVIYRDNDFSCNKPSTNVDDLWLDHIAIFCPNLTHLSLSLELAASSEALHHLFVTGKQLRELYLSDEVDAALSDTIAEAIFALPDLKTLDLHYPLTLRIVQSLTRFPVLPNIHHLSVRLSEGAGCAPGLLLRALGKVQHLNISLRNSTSNWQLDLDPDVFQALGTLKDLESLSVRFHPGLSVTVSEVAALAELEHLRYLDIAEMTNVPGLIYLDHESDELKTSTRSLLHTLMSLKKLECLHVDLSGDKLVVTYEEATLIIHLLSNLRYCHIRDFIMVSHEATSSEWPDESDWTLAIPHGAWLPTNKAFHPDPSVWKYRDLQHGVSRDGADGGDDGPHEPTSDFVDFSDLEDEEEFDGRVDDQDDR